MRSEMAKTVSATLAKLLAHKIEALLLAAAPLIAVGAAATRNALAQYVPQPAAEWAVLTTGAAVALLLTTILAWIAFRPRLEHLTKFGVYVDRKTGTYYCPKCLLTDKRRAPLYSNAEGRVWKCSACAILRINPDAPASDSPPIRPLAGTTWMGH